MILGDGGLPPPKKRGDQTMCGARPYKEGTGES